MTNDEEKLLRNMLNVDSISLLKTLLLVTKITRQIRIHSNKFRYCSRQTWFHRYREFQLSAVAMVKIKVRLRNKNL